MKILPFNSLVWGLHRLAPIKGGFLLRKWSCSDPYVLESIPTDLRDSQATVILSHSDQYTKTLGIEWNASCDHFRVNITQLPPIEYMTKRSFVYDVAKTFDSLGWYSPTIVKAKILLQALWFEGIGWDDCVPNAILEEWSKWRRELPLHYIARCYYPKEAVIVSTQLHGASERAYSGVFYLRITIPRLELNGALILAQLLSHCKKMLDLPLSHVFAWTDSTIVLAWLQGNPQRFKMYVGNRVAQ